MVYGDIACQLDWPSARPMQLVVSTIQKDKHWLSAMNGLMDLVMYLHIPPTTKGVYNHALHLTM